MVDSLLLGRSEAARTDVCSLPATHTTKAVETILSSLYIFFDFFIVLMIFIYGIAKKGDQIQLTISVKMHRSNKNVSIF